MRFDHRWLISLCSLLVAGILAFGIYGILAEEAPEKLPVPTTTPISRPIESETQSPHDVSSEPETADPATRSPETEPVTSPPDTATITDSSTTETVTEPPVTKPPVVSVEWPEFPVLSEPDPWYATPTILPTPSVEHPEHATVIKRPACVEHRVYHDFFQAGIAATVEYEPSETVGYGKLIYVEYDGFEDDSNYYVKIGTSVVLHVSDGKPGSTPSDHMNDTFYLTFDDGPTAHTDEVLAILAEYNIKATFFTAGTCMSAAANQIPGLIARGHALGCHSYSHEFPDVYESESVFLNEILSWERLLNRIMGGVLPYKLFRFPGGSNTTTMDAHMLPVFMEALEDIGYQAFDWTCSNCDAWEGDRKEGESREDYFKRQFVTTVSWLRTTSEYRISLMHETNSVTRATLEWAINHILDLGYSFRTLDELDGNQIF